MQRRQLLIHLARTGIVLPAPLAWAQSAMPADDLHAMHDMAATAGHGPAGVDLLEANLFPGGAPLKDLPRLKNISERHGVFQATLTAAPVSISLIPGQPATQFLAYNAVLPGPLIELYEGDRFELTLINQLAQATTLHWHGMPVPPEQDGNPSELVPSGARRVYRFTVPVGSAGTYWYHPHPHGHTAEQVAHGLAGPIVVRSRADPLAAIKERLLMVTDLKLDRHAAIAPSDASDLMNGREGQFVLVNGQQQPVLPFATTGRERWRIWNACSARYLLLTLPGSTFTLVGTDGGLIESPQPGLTRYMLTPAQRVELIVDAGARRDQAPLTAAIYHRGKMGDVPPEMERTLLNADFSGVNLARRKKLGPIKSRKKVVFSKTMQMNDGMHSMQFLVNGRSFDMRRIDLTSRKDEVELWEIVNEADMDHPFHLHGTQFQIINSEINGVLAPAPFRALHDTVNVRPGETVRIKIVQRWRGVRMFHCHILEHEDAGMMGRLNVI